MENLNAGENQVQPERESKERLLRKYDIPINHLDFDYVTKCNNGRELEKILHILQTGEEGYYPQLIKATEERLSVIYPKSRYIRKITPVINKEYLPKEELNELSEDLNEWLNNVQKTDEELSATRKKNAENLPEIRKAVTKREETGKIDNKRIKSTDYSSWDKYDPDTEILKMDLEAEKLKKEAESKQKGKANKERIVKFTDFHTSAEAEYEANREKEKGNEYFKVGAYKVALVHYTNSINFKPSCNNYNNRAITNMKLKKYEYAVKDCISALKYEPKNVKALLRLAQSHEQLKNYYEAITVAENLIKIDPNNTLAQNMINQLNCQLNIMPNKGSRMKILEIEDEEAKQIKLNKNSEFKENSSYNKVTYSVLLPIPGPSNMPEPYFVRMENVDLDAIRRQEYLFNNRRQIIHVTNVDPTDESECLEIHVKKSDSKFRNIWNKENISDNRQNNKSEATNSNINSVSLGNKCQSERKNVENVLNNNILEQIIENSNKEMPHESVRIEETTEDFNEVDLSSFQETDNLTSNEYLFPIQQELSCQDDLLKTEVLMLETGDMKESAEEDSIQSLSNIEISIGNENQNIDALNLNNNISDLENNAEVFDSTLMHDNRAGGEPHVKELDQTIQVEEIHMPYNFLKLWKAAANDRAKYMKQAELLKKLNINRLAEVIGYKLDGTMLSDILNTLYLHLTVPHEVARIHTALENLSSMPRFNICILFLSSEDKKKIECLFQFLEQHGQPLSLNTKRLYT